MKLVSLMESIRRRLINNLTISQPARAFLSRAFRILICTMYTSTSFSGCFRYHLAPETIEREQQAQAKRSDAAEFCKFVSLPESKSAFLYYAAGQCKMQSYRGDPKENHGARAFLSKADACGSKEAHDILQSYGDSGPLFTLHPGDSGYILFNSLQTQCGLEREITTVGWIVFPIGVPLYVAGMAVVVGGVIGVAAIGVPLLIVGVPLFIVGAPLAKKP